MSSEDGGRPSRASLREVKREYKQRQKAQNEREKAAKDYWAQQSGRSTGTRRWVAPVAGATALVVASAGAAFVLKLGPFASSATATSATGATPAATASASPSVRASASASTDGTDPTVHAVFEDSPARTWKKGMAGVALPKAHQVGIYRTAQVAAAYRMTEKYLAAAVFDPRVLYRSQVDPALVTLGSSFPAFAKKQHALWVSSHGKKGVNWLWLVTRFHPGDWKAAAETRSRGRISTATVHGGNLRVSFVVAAAYWLVPAKGGAARTIAVRREGYLDFTGYGPTNVWMTQWDNAYVSSASVCGSNWKYPEYLEAWTNVDAVASTALPGSAPAFDLTDPNATPPPGKGCFTDTSGFGH